MRKGPNPKLFLVLAIAAVILGGGASFWGYQSLTDAKARLAKLQRDSKDEKTLQADLAKAQASLQESATQLEHLEKGVPDFAYVPTMLTELERVGHTSGIDVTGVRPVPKPPTPKKEGATDGETPKRKVYEELDIEVKGRGTYRSVMNFIQAMGKFPKIVAARTVDLTPKMEPGQVGKLEVTINLRAFVFATPQPAKVNQTAMAPRVTHEG